MSKNTTDQPAHRSGPERIQALERPESPETEAWLARNIATQEQRYQAIVREMDELAPVRDQWIAEFLDIIQTRGFTVTGDTRRVIRPDELPKRPDRKHVVVF